MILFLKLKILKDSGLLTLSFGSKEAENFIDCGYFEYTFFTGEEFKGSYIDYVKVAYWQYLKQNEYKYTKN